MKIQRAIQSAMKHAIKDLKDIRISCGSVDGDLKLIVVGQEIQITNVDDPMNEAGLFHMTKDDLFSDKWEVKKASELDFIP